MKGAFERKVAATIRKHAMLNHGDHVVIAVSGGADSMALLHSLVRLAPRSRLRLTVAHLNHGIRGAEADADQDFVAGASCHLGLTFVGEKREIDGAGNFEEKARHARYGFLRRTAADAGAQKIAVGHTMNDQAETVLMRMLRGSGADGLAAIRPVLDGVIIRPLLECTRVEVIRYLAKLGVEYREDSTNRNMDYSRNRVRHELIPYLEAKFNPRLVETLARAAELSRDLSRYLEENVRQARASVCRESPEGISIELEDFRKLHPIIRKSLLREVIRACKGSLAGVTAWHVEAGDRLGRGERSGRRVLLPNGAVALLEFGKLLVLKGQADPVSFCRPLAVPGECVIQELGLRITASVKDPGVPAAPGDPACMAVLDAAAVPAAMTVRSRLPGDRYGGPTHRKVKRMLINAKVPARVRDRLPMVVAGDAVVWIPGFRPAKSFAVRPDSGRCIVLEAVEAH